MTLPSELAADVTRLVDREWLALAWYGQTIGHLCAAKGLAVVSGEPPEHLLAVPGVRSGHIVAASHDLLAGLDELDAAVVVGGPCIGDCMRYPTLESLYDSVQTLLVARALGIEAVLYLGDREEMLGAGGEGRWGKLAERFERWLPQLAEAVGWERLSVVRTSSKRHEQALERLGAPAGDADPHDLDAAFHLGAEAVREQGEAARQVTRRVIEAHLPEVVAAHLAAGRTQPPRVLIVENLQQAGVYRLASALAVKRGGRVSFLGYFPAPGPSARSRMYRSEVWDKIPAWDLEAVVQGLAPVHPYTRQFFACWLGAEQRERLADALRAF